MKGYELVNFLLNHEEAEVRAPDATGTLVSVDVTCSDIAGAIVIRPATQPISSSDHALDGLLRRVMATATYPEHGTGTPLALLATMGGIAGEGGAALNALLQVLRQKRAWNADTKALLLDNLTDVVWYVVAAAAELRMPLSTVVNLALRKAAATQREASQQDKQPELTPRGKDRAAGSDA